MGIAALRLRNNYQICDVDVKDISVKPNSLYIIETENGVDIGQTCGYVVFRDGKKNEKKGVILREASEDDLKQLPEIESLEAKAMGVCKEKIITRKLDMKLVSVKSFFDRAKMIFYFVADNRVDFRELVKDLASVFRTRIEMRQIGVRDETRIAGGYGLCGLQLCCVYLKGGFDPVSIKMAKEQNLNLNSLKISGMCGRLLCCLGYEYEVYKELNAGLPSYDTKIMVGEKVYRVISVDTLKERVRVRNESHIVDVPVESILKKSGKFFIDKEVLDNLSKPVLKEGLGELEGLDV